MAKQIPNVNILTDTYETFILRTNELAEAMREETLTANSTLAITGSELSKKNARLFGSFRATTLGGDTVELGDNISANNSGLYFENSAGININGSFGTPGQILVSTPEGIAWASVGSGTVTSITAGNGVIFSGQPVPGPLTTVGTISLRAGTGIIINSNGINVDPSFIAAAAGSTNAQSLLGQTWASPAPIGNSTPSSGNFTLVTSGAGNGGGYRIANDPVFLITSSLYRSSGWLDVTTPNSASTGGVRIRANGTTGFAFLQFTNNVGDTETGHFRVESNGLIQWSGSMRVLGSLTNNEGIHYGFRNVPQVSGNTSTTIATTNTGGRHFYKTAAGNVTLTIPDNSTDPAPIGTAITFVNDSASGNLILAQGGVTVLQIAGSSTTGNVTVGPHGLVTALKVAVNKWIVSGTGIL